MLDKSGGPLKCKSIAGKTARYLWVPCVLFDGEKQTTEQGQMQIVDDDQDNPF